MFQNVFFLNQEKKYFAHMSHIFLYRVISSRKYVRHILSEVSIPERIIKFNIKVNYLSKSVANSQWLHTRANDHTLSIP